MINLSLREFKKGLFSLIETHGKAEVSREIINVLFPERHHVEGFKANNDLKSTYNIETGRHVFQKH